MVQLWLEKLDLLLRQLALNFLALHVGIQRGKAVCQRCPKKLSVWCLNDVGTRPIVLCGFNLV